MSDSHETWYECYAILFNLLRRVINNMEDVPPYEMEAIVTPLRVLK
jgi:hypothetical protein